MPRANLSLNEDEASEVFLLLIAACGAPPSFRESFIQHATEDRDHGGEFRFQGCFGFGGKFCWEHSRWRVACYPEDRSPENDRIIAAVNGLLERMFARRQKGQQ
jgi:hypothetical protein